MQSKEREGKEKEVGRCVTKNKGKRNIKERRGKKRK